MLLRIWNTHVAPGREAAYLTYARTHSLAMFLAQDGCLGVFFVRRADGRHAVCSLWQNAAAVAALAGSPRYQQTVAGLVATGALVGEPEVEVLTLTGGGIAPALDATVAAENGALGGREYEQPVHREHA